MFFISLIEKIIQLKLTTIKVISVLNILSILFLGLSKDKILAIPV